MEAYRSTVDFNRAENAHGRSQCISTYRIKNSSAHLYATIGFYKYSIDRYRPENAHGRS